MLCRVQVSAHGTGASIPPVDEMVVSMKLITPAEGTITVSRDKCPDLFNMTRVGLGALGIVSEVTLQLVPAHHLLEHTFIMYSKVRTRQPCSTCALRLPCWCQALVADVTMQLVPAQHLLAQPSSYTPGLRSHDGAPEPCSDQSRCSLSLLGICNHIRL